MIFSQVEQKLKNSLKIDENFETCWTRCIKSRRSNSTWFPLLATLPLLSGNSLRYFFSHIVFLSLHDRPLSLAILGRPYRLACLESRPHQVGRRSLAHPGRKWLNTKTTQICQTLGPRSPGTPLTPGSPAPFLPFLPGLPGNPSFPLRPGFPSKPADKKLKYI